MYGCPPWVWYPMVQSRYPCYPYRLPVYVQRQEEEPFMYDISYEKLLVSHLDLYGRRRHRLSLLVRYPYLSEATWTPLFDQCAVAAAQTANQLVKPSMWQDPKSVLSLCKHAVTESFLQCLHPDISRHLTVEVIYRRG